MKRFKKTVAAIAVTTMVSVAIFAHAGESRDYDHNHHQRFTDDADSESGHFKHRHKGPGPFAESLDLTDAQKQTLEASRAAHEPARKEARQKLRAAHEALNNAVEQNADDATITQLANDLAALIAQQEVARVKAHKEFLSVLTPEQKEKLKVVKAEHKEPARWKSKQRSSSSAASKN